METGQRILNSVIQLEEADTVQSQKVGKVAKMFRNCFRKKQLKILVKNIEKKTCVMSTFEEKMKFCRSFVWSEEFSNSFFTKYVIHKIPFLYCTSTHLCSIIHFFIFMFTVPDQMVISNSLTANRASPRQNIHNT